MALLIEILAWKQKHGFHEDLKKLATIQIRFLALWSDQYTTYAFSNLHSRPDFWHWSHLGKFGWHLIFFSRQIRHACARRFLGFPALVTPQFAFTGIPSIALGQWDPSA